MPTKRTNDLSYESMRNFNSKFVKHLVLVEGEMYVYSSTAGAMR